MSKHNYTKYSNMNNEVTQPEAIEVVSTVAPVEPVADSVPETVTCEKCGKSYEAGHTHKCVPKTTTGVVANCVKLNVRANPNTAADAVTTLDVKSEVTVDLGNSTSEWFKVRTAAGVEGYCMKKFVNINP